VPLALTVGMLIIIGVYAGANASYHFVLPMGRIATSGGVAADVCQVMFGTFGGQLAAVGVMCSTFGAMNSNLLTGPRIYFAMARDGLLPRALRSVHGGFQTPANAILAQSAWAVVLLVIAFATVEPLERLKQQLESFQNPAKAVAEDVPSHTAKPKAFDARGAFDTLTDFVIFGGSIFYAMAVGAVFVLRFKRPDLPRPYRTWGYPVTPALYLLAFMAVLASLFYEKWALTAAGTTLILAGVVFYFVASRWAK
jgi:APA family basic amino acid/polyamine antiporter